MKSIILITLFVVLQPLSAIGQNDILARLSYNKLNSTLTVDIENISDKDISIRNLSKHSQTVGSSIELGYKSKGGLMDYRIVPLANESINTLWKEFTVIKPYDKLSCFYKNSIDFYRVDRTLVRVRILISYAYKDSTGKMIHRRYENTLNI